MSLRTHRLLALAAWVGLFLVVYAASPSRGLHLFASMLALSLVGIAFGAGWFAVRVWIEDRIQPKDGRLRSFRWAQFAIWLATVLLYAWVTVVLDVIDEAGFIGLVTLFLTPILFGVRNLLAPRSAQASA
jgi:hypothetical protein